MKKQRLSKVLAAAGIASRRASEAIIFDGRVKVNGAVADIPQTMVDPLVDKISVDGDLINLEEKVYYILNKPLGCVCTSQPSKNHQLVVDLFPAKERLFTVGRLDKETTGLLIVTNDGHLANRIIHPSSGIQKEYLVRVDKEITHHHLTKLTDGCEVEGSFVRPVRVKKLRRGTLKVVVQEGKKHEVRQLVQHAGLEVVTLSRTRIGNLQLGNLPMGQYTQVSKDELETIFH